MREIGIAGDLILINGPAGGETGSDNRRRFIDDMTALVAEPVYLLDKEETAQMERILRNALVLVAEEAPAEQTAAKAVNGPGVKVEYVLPHAIEVIDTIRGVRVAMDGVERFFWALDGPALIEQKLRDLLTPWMIQVEGKLVNKDLRRELPLPGSVHSSKELCAVIAELFGRIRVTLPGGTEGIEFDNSTSAVSVEMRMHKAFENSGIGVYSRGGDDVTLMRAGAASVSVRVPLDPAKLQDALNMLYGVMPARDGVERTDTPGEMTAQPDAVEDITTEETVTISHTDLPVKITVTKQVAPGSQEQGSASLTFATTDKTRLANGSWIYLPLNATAEESAQRIAAIVSQLCPDPSDFSKVYPDLLVSVRSELSAAPGSAAQIAAKQSHDPETGRFLPKPPGSTAMALFLFAYYNRLEGNVTNKDHLALAKRFGDEARLVDVSERTLERDRAVLKSVHYLEDAKDARGKNIGRGVYRFTAEGKKAARDLLAWLTIKYGYGYDREMMFSGFSSGDRSILEDIKEEDGRIKQLNARMEAGPFPAVIEENAERRRNLELLHEVEKIAPSIQIAAMNILFDEDVRLRRPKMKVSSTGETAIITFQDPVAPVPGISGFDIMVQHLSGKDAYSVRTFHGLVNHKWTTVHSQAKFRDTVRNKLGKLKESAAWKRVIKHMSGSRYPEVDMLDPGILILAAAHMSMPDLIGNVVNRFGAEQQRIAEEAIRAGLSGNRARLSGFDQALKKARAVAVAIPADATIGRQEALETKAGRRPDGSDTVDQAVEAQTRGAGGRFTRTRFGNPEFVFDVIAMSELRRAKTFTMGDVLKQFAAAGASIARSTLQQDMYANEEDSLAARGALRIVNGKRAGNEAFEFELTPFGRAMAETLAAREAVDEALEGNEPLLYTTAQSLVDNALSAAFHEYKFYYWREGGSELAPGDKREAEDELRVLEEKFARLLVQVRDIAVMSRALELMGARANSASTEERYREHFILQMEIHRNKLVAAGDAALESILNDAVSAESQAEFIEASIDDDWLEVVVKGGG
ncbi:MAG: hypothetical protein PHX20_07980, partial [Candidatus Omnitrophica bacterium]|nr:hypothetical protein [Candidatus Omnitrophota bacterium]